MNRHETQILFVLLLSLATLTAHAKTKMACPPPHLPTLESASLVQLQTSVKLLNECETYLLDEQKALMNQYRLEQNVHIKDRPNELEMARNARELEKNSTLLEAHTGAEVELLNAYLQSEKDRQFARLYDQITLSFKREKLLPSQPIPFINADSKNSPGSKTVNPVK